MFIGILSQAAHGGRLTRFGESQAQLASRVKAILQTERTPIVPAKRRLQYDTCKRDAARPT